MQKIDQDLIYISAELAKNPDSERLKNVKASMLNNKALILGQSQRFNDAIKCLNQAIDLNPTEVLPTLITNKASLLHKASRFNESIECASKLLLDIDINNEKANELLVLNYSTLATIDNEKGNNLEALKKVEKALEIRPKDSVLLYNKATILNELEKLDEALEFSDQSIAFDSNLSSAKTLKAFIFHKQALAEADKKNYDEAINKIDKAIEINPSETAFLINKGSFLIKLKRYDSAIETANIVLEQQPSNSDALTIKNISSKYIK